MKFKVEKLARYQRLQEPVTAAMPIPKAALRDAADVQVYCGEQLLPTQSRITAVWPDGSIKWLLINFLADLPANSAQEFELRFTKSTAQPLVPVLVAEHEHRLQLRTGDLVVTLADPADGGLFHEAVYKGWRLDHRSMAELGVLKDGQRYYTVITKPGWSMIESGPVRAVLEASGTHLNADGAKVLDFLVRIYAFAGKPWLWIDYQVINRSEADLELSGLGWHLNLNPHAAPVRTAVAVSNYRTTIRSSEAGDALEHKIDAEQILYEPNEQIPETLYGTFWADWNGAQGGVAVTIFQAHQNFPKRLAAAKTGLDVELRFDKPLRTGISGPFAKNFQNGWENEFIGAKPFFVAEGLTFINCGSDLIYAGAMLYSFTGNEKPLQWAKTLAQQYFNARDPVTKLGSFQYSQSRNQAGPPDDPDNIQYAWQTSGDRAQRQFGHEFGDLALEGRFLHKEHDEIYGKNAIIQLQIAEMLGDAGQEFLSWTHEGLRAFAQYAYNMEESTVKPMWSDGTDLSGYQLKRSGYYGEQGTVLLPRRAGSIYLLSFALGYRLTQDPLLWKVARRVAMDHQLGDLGVQPGEEMDLNMATPNADPVALFSLLDIYRGTHETAYLELACRIGDNIIGQYFNEGFFAGKNNIYAPTDSEEAFALIALETAVRGDWDAVPRYNSGRGFIHGNYDGYGRTYDKVVFWQQAK